MKKPCEKCGHNRWKTKHKQCPDRLASAYECRKCGYIRFVGRFEKLENE